MSQRTSTYTVTGMTCDHCAQAVKTEISGLPGVTEVGVDLASGHVVVQRDQQVDDRAVRRAVEEAGYEVVT